MRRLSDTAVTRFDCSIEKATISEYDVITADERDVGAVQRRDHARHPPVAGRGQHLLRQEGRRGVWHRVVRVDDVEVVLARHLHDPVGERQQVLRLAKQRIGRRQHLMERQPGLELAEPERRLGADEVHLVPAQRERLSELGGDDAAAADGRVTDDSDVHQTSPKAQIVNLEFLAVQAELHWPSKRRNRWGAPPAP